MWRHARLKLFVFALTSLALFREARGAMTLTNPIVFVTQPPIARELNSTVSNTFLSVVTEFGNHLADTAHAGRGGDLWLMTTNLGLVNLTRKGGFGTNGIQAGGGIAVRDPSVHWGAGKLVFSMAVGAPTNATDTRSFFWQMYELTNLAALIANTNTIPQIVPVSGQPTNYNNVNPTFATDGRIIFMSDRPFGNQTHLYPQRDEYKSAPSVTGTYSLDPATGDLKILEHLPSGGFNPFVDSFGRLIITRWDHLIQDGNATGDRLGRTTNGAFNFFSELPGAATQSTNTIETFPEPNDFDTAYCAQLGLNPDLFNVFLPWALDPDGGNEEVLNHVGRHEISFPTLAKSFRSDTNLVDVTNLTSRAASGVISANTNALLSLFQITEDPRTNGLYWGVNAQDISIFGGNHSAGAIVTLSGPPTLNPTGMVVNLVTPANGANGPNSLGLFRNPLPMSDGLLIASFTPTKTSFNFGWDTNTGTASLPTSQYQFRLMTLQPSGALWTTNQNLTAGLTNLAIYWDGATLVTNAGQLWELQPVEVRSRPVPTAVHTPVNPIEQQVFVNEGVDLPTFQGDLAARGMALVVSRNLTARDSADKQQPFNLTVPGGVSSIANSGTAYAITHLQFLQADYLRGYNLGTTNVLPGRRVLATPMHDTTSFNYSSGRPNPPIGGTQIMPDGSQATIVPANRALTWQLTGTNTNDSVVKERYWITFRPGEVRTCANCHGINEQDQLGRPAPANPPQALQELLRFWRTNSANGYTLTVSNGTGSGVYGAGSILMLTASPAPPGTVFAGWIGSGISNATSPTTSFTMPGSAAIATATFTNLPAPFINQWQITSGTNFALKASASPNRPWVLESSYDLNSWFSILTNTADSSGLLQMSFPISGQAGKQFFRLRAP